MFQHPIDWCLHIMVGFSIMRLVPTKAALPTLIVLAIGKEVWDYYSYGSSLVESVFDVGFTLLGGWLAV